MRRRAQSGVTLVEILVVLVIIAILTGIVVAALGGADQRADARSEARRLANRINLAVDEALVTSTVLALTWDERSYRFESWNPDDAEWQRYSIDLLGQPHQLSEGLRLEAEQSEGDERKRLPIGPNGTGGPIIMSIVGASNDWRIVFDGLSASTLSPSE